MAAEARAGLLIDWGGVMTSNLMASFAAFCQAQGLDSDALIGLFRANAGARDLGGGRRGHRPPAEPLRVRRRPPLQPAARAAAGDGDRAPQERRAHDRRARAAAWRRPARGRARPRRDLIPLAAPVQELE